METALHNSKQEQARFPIQRITESAEETPNSNVEMKTARILPHLLLPKPKSETNGSSSKTLSRRIN